MANDTVEYEMWSFFDSYLTDKVERNKFALECTKRIYFFAVQSGIQISDEYLKAISLTARFMDDVSLGPKWLQLFTKLSNEYSMLLKSPYRDPAEHKNETNLKIMSAILAGINRSAQNVSRRTRNISEVEKRWQLGKLREAQLKQAEI